MIKNHNNYVFVYGTLRKGGMYSSLLHGSEYIGNDLIPRFVMRDLGEYPMIFESDNPESLIVIEIYKINHHTLQQLDNLEEYIEGDENSLYLRKTVSTVSGRKGYIYYGKDERKYLSYDIIPGGDWIKRNFKTGVIDEPGTCN
ncbi:MAG TPA: gamma-glutamylcyclotransferase [Spirochaetota bacterium]|nr:gamma-glutamylcyclotransferase [Spirochaetota bacterium]HPJ41662.1 gamma-glutamylcyclotransferase [Spirochaetota bacterium]HRX49035.1 gamma-glutamylcyclotransferase [Spirochaetota bacterium]